MCKSLYLIDGHYQIFRAYYAPFDRLTAPSGEPTKATHAFCGMLFNLIRNRKPDYLAMVMDVSDETVFRRSLFPEYKANREAPPEDFAPQAKRIVSIVEAMEIPILRVPTFEADDVMATIATRLARDDLDVYLVSRDKDLEQLITERVRMYDPTRDETVDAESLLEKKGYTPAQAVEIQTLTGDTVDNVPGVTGVGPKTAIKLINQYGSAQAVVENADKLTPKQSERVRAFAERIDLTRQLVTLRRDVPLEFSLDASAFTGPPIDKVQPIFSELGFHRLSEQLRQISPDSKSSSPPPPAPPAPKAEAGSYTLIDTPEKLAGLARQLSKVDVFAFDTETTSLNPVDGELVGLSFAWRSCEACYIPIRAAMGDTLELDLVVETLKPVFEDANIGKCGHNLKFDTLVMRQVGIRVAGVAFDTMIASYLLEPQRMSHGLDGLARDILDHTMIPISDLIGKGKHQITIDDLDAARVGEYASEDADFTWRLYEHYQPMMADSELKRVFEEVELPLVTVLAEMENNGVKLDTDILADMSAAMTERLAELSEQIHAEAGHPFNIDSTRQLAVVLFDELGLEVIRKTKTGRSTDADTLATLASTSTSKVPGLVLEYRELTKLKNTYVDTLPSMISRRTGRIHSSFHSTGAITGRLSSSDPNLQNIPVRTETGRRIRSAFVARDDEHELLTADYSQIELRIMAHFCGDERLKEAFNDNQDIHAFVAAQVNGVDIDEVTSEQRSAAKAVNFGIIYGQTPFGLARSLGIPVAEAKEFIDTYFLRYPGIRMFIDRCIKGARSRGYVQTILGRRRPIEELQSRNRQRQAFGERIAVNTVIQGSAADLIKRAMVDIHEEITLNRRPSRMLLQVHDELVFEIPRREIETEEAMIREKMCGAIPLDVPVAVDVRTGRNWLEGK